MTNERLKELARQELNAGIAELRRTGGVGQAFTVFRAEGSPQRVAPGDLITNSERAKEALGRIMHARIAMGGVDAVIMISDIWYTWMEIDSAQDKERKTRRLTVSEAHDAGLCTKTEAICVMAESPSHYSVLIQPYAREGDGRIKLLGEPEYNSVGLAKPGGRFAGYKWPQGAGAPA